MTLQLYDDFSQSYTLGEGATSPNGKWKNIYRGLGSVVVGNGIIITAPNITDGRLHATHTTSTWKAKLPHTKFRFRLDKQAVINGTSLGWYSKWPFIKDVNNTTHYYLLLKTTGIQLGKKDNDLPPEEEHEEFIKTASTPFCTLGSWDTCEALPSIEFDSQLGKNNIRWKIWINGNLVIDVFDRKPWLRNGTSGVGASQFMMDSMGGLGLYNEACQTSWDDVQVEDMAVVQPPPPDTEMPVIVLTSPANNSTITGDQVTVRGTSSDNVGVVKMESQIDSQPYVVMNKDASGYYMTYTGVTEGEHEARIRATDAAGNSGIAQSFFRRLTVRRITTRAGDGKSELVISADSISSDKPIDVQ